MTQFRAASERDLEDIAHLEERSDYRSFLCASSASEHGRRQRDPDYRYIVAEDHGRFNGFLILRGFTNSASSIELQRMAVEEPGLGHGRTILQHAQRLVFDDLDMNRLWLDVFENNVRARALYRAAGFTEEGLLREAARRRDGTLGSLVVMAMLRREYRP